MGDEGTLVKRGGDLDGGPLGGAQLCEEDVDIDGLGDQCFAGGEKAAREGHVQHVAMGIRRRVDPPLFWDGVELALLPLCT